MGTKLRDIPTVLSEHGFVEISDGEIEGQKIEELFEYVPSSEPLYAHFSALGTAYTIAFLPVEKRAWVLYAAHAQLGAPFRPVTALITYHEQFLKRACFRRQPRIGRPYARK